ncbi:MAG TPA: cohesin domain-containing protein, partial [Verrucomicrobiae bacterium]|nr:cohesin domain-containing protein [Verrucomicrobiae bacterium]
MLFYKIKIQKKQLTTLLLGAFVLSGFFGLFVPKDALAAQATLSLSPSNGRFEIDSTFEISVFLNTHGNSVNTIELNLRYPPDKLQLVSSSTGQSIIGIWTSQPKYNNLTGAVNLVGGIPNGINVSKGLISTFTFRVKAVGSAVVRFENSRVLLNDGLGTEVLTQNVNSIYDLTLPAPAGPLVVSDTHPDQTQWYKDSTVSLRWGDEGGSEGFSYILSDEPIDIPDNISEGTRHEVDYKNLSEGRHYFHIRALRAGAWGGTTHYALNIDPAAPADFRVEIVPGARTTRRQPVLQFSTTDASSGLDHYELKIIPLGQNSATVTPQDENQQIFIEAQSPFITSELELGRYDIIVRAYDKAGNYKDATERLEIVNAIFRYVDGQGLEIRSWLVLPWWLLLILLALVVILLLYLISRLHLWHRTIDSKREQGEMPANLKQQIE